MAEQLQRGDQSRDGLADAVARLGYVLRPARAEDEAFQQSLFIAVRWPELDGAPWPDDAKSAFLAQQFQLQSRHYATHYHDSRFLIVEHAGRPVGRLILHQEVEVRIVDIAVAPEAQGQGIGTAVLGEVLAQAREAGLRVTIHVEKNNPAQRLYRRLGFEQQNEEGPYWLMAWQPPANED